jgi:hypothetical protein
MAIQWLTAKVGELLIWMVLVVLFSLFPIYVVYYDTRLSGALSVSAKELVMKGELLLVAGTLAADSLSRLISRTFAKRNQLGAFGLPQLVLLLASPAFIQLTPSQYADLAGRLTAKTAIDSTYVYHQSIIFFATTLLAGAGVILVD